MKNSKLDIDSLLEQYVMIANSNKNFFQIETIKEISLIISKLIKEIKRLEKENETLLRHG